MTVLLLLVLLTACSVSVGPQPDPPIEDDGLAYVPGAEWRTASPSAAGFDADGFDDVVDGVRDGRYGAVTSVVVVRYGYVVAEQYVGWQRGSAHTMQSVSKSITSLLFGMLQDRETSGDLALDRPVIEIFPRYPDIAGVDDRKRSLTLGHLLSMRTGMDFWEQPYPGSPLDQLNRSTGDWVKFILDRPMTSEPGTGWAYNSGATILTCGVLREVSGESPDAFARRELFAPIGVTGESWYRSPFDGLPHCGGGLSLKPLDLARIGYLVLRGGRWGDRQVVPQEWIEASTAPISRGSSLIFSNYNSAYGYYWWLFPGERGGADTDVITASGAGGQWLFVVPRLDLVIAMTATNGFGLDLLYDVLPTLTP
jgi:CubicO group peptidase (beta-lactamase class C family)